MPSIRIVGRFIGLIGKLHGFQFFILIAGAGGLLGDALTVDTEFRRLGWVYYASVALTVAAVSWVLISTIRVQRSMEPRVHAPFFICLGQPTGRFEVWKSGVQRTIDKKVPWRDVQGLLRVHDADWTHFSELVLSDDEGTWRSAAENIEHHFWGLSRRVGAGEFHLFMAAPPSIAFRLGATVGRRALFNVYQFSNDVDEYKCVSSSTDGNNRHESTQRIAESDRTLIEVKPDEHQPVRDPTLGRRSVLLAIEFTSKRIPRPMSFGECDEALTVTLRTSHGTIPFSVRWGRLAEEVASAASDFTDGNHNVTIVLNVPTVFAFMLGRIIGPNALVSIAEYNAYLKKELLTFRRL